MKQNLCNIEGGLNTVQASDWLFCDVTGAWLKEAVFFLGVKCDGAAFLKSVKMFSVAQF